MTANISKKMIFDLTAWLMDERVAGTEFQRIAQDFILERTEIYAADLLVMQYSTTKGHSKSEVNYKNTKGVLQVILMKNSPDVFDQPEVGDRYIHRFESQNKTQAGSCRVMVCRGRCLVCPAFL